jgi:AraC-like DNA-binding protein
MVFRPDDAHDGHAQDETGFKYAMIYVPDEYVRSYLSDALSKSQGDFRQPLVDDAAVAGLLANTVNALLQPQESLRASAMLTQTVVALFERHAGARPSTDTNQTSAAWLVRVRDYLEVHYASDVSADELAKLANVTRVHLTRSFNIRYGLPPHGYLNRVRLYNAMRQLSSGAAIADVAAGCGFADQSHLTRRFKGTYGVTPGAWLATQNAGTATAGNAPANQAYPRCTTFSA